VSGRCLVCKHGSHVTGIPTLSSKTTRYTNDNNRSQTLVGSGIPGHIKLLLLAN